MGANVDADVPEDVLAILQCRCHMHDDPDSLLRDAYESEADSEDSESMRPHHVCTAVGETAARQAVACENALDRADFPFPKKAASDLAKMQIGSGIQLSAHVATSSSARLESMD